MTQYTCPNCRGGFPFPPENELDTGETPECPWCGQALDGSYEYEPPHAFSTVRSKPRGEQKGVLGRLFGIEPSEQDTDKENGENGRNTATEVQD